MKTSSLYRPWQKMMESLHLEDFYSKTKTKHKYDQVNSFDNWKFWPTKCIKYWNPSIVMIKFGKTTLLQLLWLL